MAGLSTTRASVIGLLAALALFTIFLFSYAGAFHDPEPHRVPIGVLDARTAAALDASGGTFVTTIEKSLPGLEQAIKERKVAGGVVGHRLYVSSAASFTTASYLKAAFARQDPRIQAVELAPLPQGDARGVSLFYGAIAWVFGGYFGATLITVLAGAASVNHRRAFYRVGALALFSVAAGLVGALLLDFGLGAIEGHFLPLAGVGMLVCFAAGAATAGLQSALGVAGTLVAMVSFIMLGNPSSGGAYSGVFMPGFWRVIGPWLPTGAGVSALRGVVYFDGSNVAGRFAVLGAYALAGSVLIVAIGRRRGFVASPEAELATAASL